MAVNNEAYLYSVTGARAAKWNGTTQLYNSSVVVPNLKSISLDPQIATDMRSAYGRTVGQISILTDVEVSLNFTGIDFPSAAEMTGRTVTYSGTSGTRYTDGQAGGAGLAYFGLNCSCPADDGSEVHFLFPYLKLEADIFGLAMEENKFATKEATARGMSLKLNTGVYLVPYRMFHRDAVTALETDFNLWKTLLATT